MARVCVLLAEGFEEIEAITVIDMLRRVEIETVMLGLTARRVRGSHGIEVAADRTLAEAAGEPWDLVYLPGGMPGATHLRDDARVRALLQAQIAGGRKVAAICAAPIALEAAGVLAGRRVTSHPGFAGQLASASEYCEDRVVADGLVLTSRGPGTAAELALEIVGQLRSPEAAERLRAAMLWG